MSANAPANKAPQTLISGRISAVDSYPPSRPTRFNTLVRLPAADEFTTPETVEVVSERSIGEVGQVVTELRCVIGGRYRSYNVTDKKTGELRLVKTADNSLTVL